MNKKGKIMLTSCMTIALSASLIAGSTYALFTSKSETDITISSATVKVNAHIGNLKTYSYTEQNGVFEETQMENNNFIYGTAVYEGNTLTLSNMIPGDKITFDVIIENKSTVDVKYCVKIGAAQNTEETSYSDALFGALTKDYTDYDGSWTMWKHGEEGDTKTIGVVIALSYSCEDDSSDANTIQGKTCGITITVEAIQGNGNPQA